MKERVVKQCLKCKNEYTKSYIEGTSIEYAKCPWCFVYESTVMQGGYVYFRVVRTEVLLRERTWWNPFGWGTGRWVTKKYGEEE